MRLMPTLRGGKLPGASLRGTGLMAGPHRPLVAIALAFGLAMPGAAAWAQGVPTSPSLPPPLPTRPGAADPIVQVDPDRVFGDDSPAFSPFALLGGFGLGIRAGLITEYSDNVARVEEGEPLRTGLVSKNDWSFRPTIGLSATRPVGRQSLFLNADLGRTFFARNTILDREYLSVGGGLLWQLGVRCGGTVQGGWTKRGTQFSAFDEVVPSSTEQARFSANASCPTAGGLTPNISYDFFSARTRVDEEFADEYDRSFADVNSHGLSGGLSYRLSTRGEVGVQGQWRRSTYPNQFIGIGRNNYNTITGLNGFVNYRFGRSLTANGSLGFSKVGRPEGLGEGFSGAVWSAGLTYSGPRIGASINGGRSVNGATGGNANYTVAKHFAGNVSYQMNSRLGAAAGFIWRESNMIGLSIIPNTQLVDLRKLNRYFVGVDYRLNSLLAFSLDYNHQRLRTEPVGFGYRENSVRFGIRATL